MLQVLEEFRSRLDDVMHRCMDKRFTTAEIHVDQSGMQNIITA